MIITELLTIVTVTALVLHNAARIPAALTEFLNACLPLARAARDLTTILNSGNDSHPADHDQDPSR
ncbi:hypothetical protein ACFXNW_10995 [Nocardia sp. NPDC059180]|uniref:hypothetical protein n=1 Tax=Nocardia sp. NPDC059180 TaxID=3346761 RepID=UPI0036C5B17D